MLNNLSPDIRTFLIDARSMAMQDGTETAIENIRIKLSKKENLSVANQAAINLLQAELYYLNNQSADSVNIFEAELTPILKQVPKEMKISILRNKNIVSFNTLNPSSESDFYYLYDYRKLSKLDPWNSTNLLRAYEAAEKGEHYDVLPEYWQHLLFTFNQGIWNIYADACSLMSKECISLGWFPQAAYYAILSQDTKWVKALCKGLVGSGDLSLIEQVLDIIILKSNLLRHASVACKLIEEIHDEIPDAYLDITVDYLLSICSYKRQNFLEINPIINAWKSINSLSHRLSPTKASELLNVITGHEWFNSVNPNRRYLIDVVNNLIEILPQKEMLSLAQKIVPFAKEKKSDIDYANVINLLLHIAFKDKDKSKNYLAKQLYPKGEKIDSISAQIAKDFGEKIKYANIEQAVNNLSQNILFQVQKLKPEEKSEDVFDTFGNIEKVNKDKNEKIIIQISSDHHLRALIANKDLLNSSHMEILINAFEKMIKEKDNSLRNKLILINAIIGFSGKFTEIQKKRIFELLEPLAKGHVIEGSVMMSHAEANNPLNRFKMKDTKPEMLSAGALYALSCLEKDDSGNFSDKINNLILESLANDNHIIRKNGYDSTIVISKISDRLLLHILFGTRDPDYHTAIAAFEVIINRKDINLSLDNWHIFFISLYEAAYSEHKELRRVSAIISKQMISKAPLEYKSRIQELTKKLKTDICYSVRISTQKI